MSRIISKKLNRFVKKNRSKLLLSLTVISIFLFFLGICLLQRVKPNGDILLQNTGSKSLYMNVNPSFNVSFGNRENPEQQWVRFESVNSTKNPFGEKKRSLWNKIVNAIKPRKNLGVEMSLRTVELNGVEKLAETDSLERVKSVAEVLGTSEIKTSTRLIDMGRVIGDDSKENVSKKTIVNTDVIDGVDLEYQIIEGVGLKEEIVIRNLDGYSEECKSDVSKCKLPPNEFVFDMRLDDGLNLKKGWFTVGQKSYETYYFEDNDGNYVSHFLPSFAVDGIGNKTFDVLLDVVESGDGNYKVRVTVDIEWLFDNKRVFPVRIDPSIVHNSKANFDTGTYISSEYVQSVAGVQLVGVENQTIDENTVGYWSFDGTLSNVIPDSSGNNNDGTLTGGNIVVGRIGKALELDGVDDYVTTTQTLPSLSSYTISFWAKWNNYGTDQVNFLVGSRTLEYLEIHTGGGSGVNGLRFIPKPTVYLDVPNAIPDSDWHFYTFVNNGASEAFVYRDGILLGSKTHTVTTVASNYLDIGRRGAQANYYFKGLIDEVSVSDVVRDAAYIYDLYRSYIYPKEKHSGEYISGVLDSEMSISKVDISSTVSGVSTGDGETPYSTTGLVAQWNFNETSGTVASSGGSCGSTCNGTLTNFSNTSGQDKVVSSGWTYNNRRWGSGGLMFDGVDDYVTSNNSNIGNMDSGDLSLEAWFKAEKEIGSNYPIIMSKHIGTPDRKGYDLLIIPSHYDTAGRVSFEIHSNGQTGIGSRTVVTDGLWHYVAITKSSGLISLYIDGILEDYHDFETTLGDLTNTSPFEIGRLGGLGGNFFHGVIDVVRIYNRALTSSEVSSNYNSNAVKYAIRGGNSNNPNDGTWSEWKDNSVKSTLKSFDNTSLYESNEDGLVGYWSMDEESGTTVNDVSGTGNNGTATGTSIVDGKYGKGRSFNGTSDYISLASAPFSGASSFTVSSWINTSNTGTRKDIFSVGAGASTNDSFYFFVNSSNGISVDLTNVLGPVSTTTVADGNWHHVAVTNTSGTIQLYVDGIASGNSQAMSPAIATTMARIGRSVTASSPHYFQGNIDELKVYNKNLSTSDIQLLYLEGIDKRSSLTHNSSKIAADTNDAELSYKSSRVGTTINDGLIAYWKMDEESGNTVADSVGTNNGTATGTTIVGGTHGNSRSFNGTEYVSIGNIGTLPDRGTIQFWVNSSEMTVYRNALTTSFSGGNNAIRFEQNPNGAFYSATGNGTNLGVCDFFISSSMQINTWYHITYTWDKVANVHTGFLNGAFACGGSNTYWPTGTQDMRLGSGYSAAADRQWKGLVDEVKLFNKQKKSQEIFEEYASLKTTFEKKNTGLVAYWNMDETSGTIVADFAGTNVGTATGTTIVNGKINNGRDFNGSSDYITLPSGLKDFTTGITINLWARPTSNANWSRFIDFGQVSGQNSTNIIFYRDSTSSSLYLSIGSGSIRAADGIINNQWHFYTATVDTSGTGKIYRDGVLLTQGSIPLPPNVTRPYNYIGKSNWSADALYQGQMDEVKIYNKALSISEIRTEYTQGAVKYSSSKLTHLNHTLPTTNLSSKISLPVYIASDSVGEHISTTVGESAYANYQPDANTVGLWHLDEIDGNGPYIKDSSGYNNDGIPIGSTYTHNGQIGGGRSFNAVNDEYISIKNSSNLNPTAITLEAWIKPTNFDRAANFINKGDNAGYRFRVDTTGAVSFLDRGSTNALSSPANIIPLNQWTHAVVTGDSTGLKIYINGVLVVSNTTAYGSPVTTNPLYIGKAFTTESFTGLIDEVRISNIARTPDEIRQAYEVGLRTHNIEIEFGAMLDNSNLITSSTDTSFTIDGTTKGMRDKGSNIYTGEKIIVREQNSTGEYIAQGIVTSVNKDTGAITVKEWESISTFPTGGFTTKANVFKWQKEYLPIKGRTLDTHLDQANLLTIRIENGYGGRNIWIDNLTTEEYTPTVSTETINLGDSYRFFQYKAVLTSTDTNTSPIIQQVQLDYTSDGPTMEQIMRHGKWFNNGTKQPFWWAK